MHLALKENVALHINKLESLPARKAYKVTSWFEMVQKAPEKMNLKFVLVILLFS